ncbi:PAS domain S-box protein [Hydrogenophaga sp.]|uniref:PAS domain S-box protein n=1 Tax=Hydrogenophaga sp. TaxID=1904254 RepID=UPI00391D4CE2
MSVLFPSPDNPSQPHQAGLGWPSREQALLQEIEALRAENQHLREMYAKELTQGVGKSTASHPSFPKALPLPLEHALVAGMAGESNDARLAYEALFAALSSAFPIGIFRTDHAGVLTHVDAQLEQIFGLNKSDFPNFGWMALVHPDDQQQVSKAWEHAITNHAALSVEFRIVRNGDVRYLLVRNAQLRDDGGRVVSQLGFVQDITPLRQLEADARIKDELNRQIIASSPDCTKVLNLQGQVLEMTAQGCRLIEVDDFAEVRLSDWATWWPDPGQQQAREAIANAVKGKSARFVAFGKTFKGNDRWWDNVISPICDAQGRPIMLLVVSRDITELHRQQEEIQRFNVELETRVRERTDELAKANDRVSDALTVAEQLYDRAPCGYHSVNADGIFVMMNQTELDWLGYERSEVIGKMRFRDVGLQEHWAMAHERLQCMVRGEKIEPMEFTMRRRDGSTFVALISSTAVMDSHGQFVRTNNTVVDITQRKVAEEALAAQTRFLKTITDTVPVQLAYFDRELICRFANASYARWRNADADALLGRHLRDIAQRHDYDLAKPRMRAALRGAPQRFEGERELPDGQRFYASIEYTPFVHDGQVLGVIVQMVDITDRKASEDRVNLVNTQLAEALNQARALYNQAPCGYHSLDLHGTFVSINDTELEWLGYRREEVVGRKNFRDVIPSSQVPLLEARMQRLLLDDALEGVEYELRRRDGTTFHALLSSTPVRNEQGQFLRSNTTVVDISRRKAAEMALRENQRFLQNITDHVPGLIAYVDHQLVVKFANAEHLRVFGKDPREILGRSMTAVMSHLVWPDIEPLMRAALQGQAQHHETWMHAADGTPIFVSASFLPDVSEGQVRGIFVQLIDITERKRVEERVLHLNDELEVRIRERSAELIESEQRFRLMVDNLRDYCIYFMDAAGIITDWTDSAQRMDGYPPAQMQGKHFGVLFNSADPQAGQAEANRVLRMAASRGQHDGQTWHTRKDGTRYWAHSVLIALRDNGGELRGFAKINRDMTDAKRLNDLLRNINDELEQRVVERTEQLVAANRDLESFSYSVSHDLRSPLRHIASFVTLLEEHLGEKVDEVSARYLNTIASSARHMSQLIDGLLAFSRLGRAAINLTPVDLKLLVNTAVSQIEHETAGRVVEWVIAPDLPVVHADALLLREVWANLLGNAVKYTRPRERAVIEITWQMDQVLGYVFSVRDNGVGFDTKYSQKLFGVFQRLHRATEFEGTGIGLALTRRIVERHGGSIWAESQIGHGSVFHFSLPFDGPREAETPDDHLPAPLEP